MTQEMTATNLSRDELRALLLGDKPTEHEVLFKGKKLVLREPPLGQVLDFQAMAQEDRKTATALLMVRYVYVPGTDERVFDEADADVILSMPFSKDLSNLLNNIIKMTEVAVTDADKSEATEKPSTVDNPQPQ